MTFSSDLAAGRLITQKKAPKIIREATGRMLRRKRKIERQAAMKIIRSRQHWSMDEGDYE